MVAVTEKYSKTNTITGRYFNKKHEEEMNSSSSPSNLPDRRKKAKTSIVL